MVKVKTGAADDKPENIHVRNGDGSRGRKARAGDTLGQQRVHRRIGGAVALRARVEAPPALARDRREDPGSLISPPCPPRVIESPMHMDSQFAA